MSPAATGSSGRGTAAPTDLAERRRLIDGTIAGTPLVEGVIVEEADLGGVPVLRCRPAVGHERTVLWFHGGGYRLGSARLFQPWSSHLAAATRSEVVSVDYRLAPEHPFPDALFDALLAYTAILPGGGPLLIGGDSAGGGLAAALLLAIGDRGLPPPLGAVLCSPWLDLRNTAASMTDNTATDALFSHTAATEAAALYLAGHPAIDPLASPLLGDWKDRVPVLVQSSRAEVLRDDAIHFGEVCPSARVELYDGLPHVWHLGFPDAPGSVEAVASICRFVDELTR